MDKIIIKTDGVDVELKVEGNSENLIVALITAMNQEEDFAAIISADYELYWNEDIDGDFDEEEEF